MVPAAKKATKTRRTPRKARATHESVLMVECKASHSNCKNPTTDSICGRREGHLDAGHKCKQCNEWF